MILQVKFPWKWKLTLTDLENNISIELTKLKFIGVHVFWKVINNK